ncbi:MAG: transcriptional regulator NrdR [Phycisphaeraceae bacterium]
MRCPYCHDNDDKVIDSRSSDGGKAIRRRRQCNTCGKRFTTYEHIERQTRLNVIKRDGTRVPYDREKLTVGIQKACYKRPIPAEKIVQLVDSIEEDLFRLGEREVASLEIGKRVAERLKRLDQVAYIRFASVYMRVRNIDDLLDEVLEIKESSPPPPPREQGNLF